MRIIWIGNRQLNISRHMLTDSHNIFIILADMHYDSYRVRLLNTGDRFTIVAVMYRLINTGYKPK